MESLEGIRESEGGGSATLEVGDDSWTFDKVVCGFGPDQIGDPDAEFVLSPIQEGLQLSVSVDGFGHSVEIADIANLENPSVYLVASSFTARSRPPVPERRWPTPEKATQARAVGKQKA